MTSTSALPRLGLTGGIGSGKSTVAEIWRRAGHRVIDLDARSREVLDAPGDGVEEAIARFGEEYRGADGTVDRAAMARLVFADDAARADLERIVLGRVDAAVAREEQEAADAGERLLIHDSPLLLEKQKEKSYRVVVAVLARRGDRIARVVRDRGKGRAYVESIMAAQVSDLDRIRRADHLVLNTGTREDLERRARRVLARVLEELGLPDSAVR